MAIKKKHNNDKHTLYVVGREMNEFIKKEIKNAIESHNAIVVMEPLIFNEVIKLVEESGEKVFDIKLNPETSCLMKKLDIQKGIAFIPAYIGGV